MVAKDPLVGRILNFLTLLCILMLEQKKLPLLKFEATPEKSDTLYVLLERKATPWSYLRIIFFE